MREQPQLLDTVPPMMERQVRQLVALIDRLPGVFERRSTDTSDQSGGIVEDGSDGCTR